MAVEAASYHPLVGSIWPLRRRSRGPLCDGLLTWRRPVADILSGAPHRHGCVRLDGRTGCPRPFRVGRYLPVPAAWYGPAAGGLGGGWWIFHRNHWRPEI